MRPPWLWAESHAHRQLNTLPRCMRPEGDGAKRPTTGAGALMGAGDAPVAVGVAMLRVLISMRTSIAREVGETPPRLAGWCGRALREADYRLDGSVVANQLDPLMTETPAALRNCRGFRGKGGHDPRANGKGANRFRSTALCPSFVGSISAYHAHTKPLHL